MSPEERAHWLSQVEEPILEPHRRIIDPHHHLWKNTQLHSGPYGLEDLWADTSSGHAIEKTVFVQCGAEYRTTGPEALKPLGETEFVTALAQASSAAPNKAQIAGIVGHADLRLGAAVAEVLQAHIEIAGDLFKGIRHVVAADADPEMRQWSSRNEPDVLTRPDFREGFAALSEFGFTFDSWNYHTQISQLTDLARAFPQTTIVLDHFGSPIGIGAYATRYADVVTQWRKDIAALAQCPNVVAKLGGLAMPHNGFGWHQRATPATSDEIVAAHRDFYLHTIDIFSPDRCMFESNFPVDKVSVSYPVFWNAAKKIAAPFTEEEKDKMFYGTAQWIYRL